ncbi:MAG TPA: hypothetical protein DCQ26_17900 [Marinilabiliales bacterium]|nr:MAG: hypothetical protein A2W96_02490 [Bacteroidetes bacterium GWD2_40_43]OFX90808.1 MAG: hypothetical protein A2W97_03555 [Bacteroidetes bacterium GWE2_40_63]OFY20560.1 MAG: hypothetical protein A2W88_13285 [Bacteroidetes bacterium GWF2_40_13]OFZ24118.1 MAG: hypothetical protein A2437_10850 [Bacteroidetes bacterium RIFOXYC2_FULL_40_12]HAN00470.1 hypothetical protein [Marinilabiliales bacterium]
MRTLESNSRHFFYYYELSTRNSQNGAMDQLGYVYDELNGHKRNNRLLQVTDAVDGATLPDDIDSQPENNYTYDELGNLTANQQDHIASITWTPGGKIEKITRTTGAHSLPDLEFAYDAAGNRTMKLVKPRSNGILVDESQWSYTFYVRDAQGNQLATYQQGGTNPMELGEFSLFGSDRLGTLTVDQTLNSIDFTQPVAYSLGHRQYELKNHLGNVLATVSGFKNTTTNTASLLTATDYYPFGSPMPGRVFDNGYRFGFNGKETDSEWSGQHGATYDYGFRIFDSRIAKFLSVDPLTKSYPWYTPYQFAGNTPIQALDLDGLEILDYRSMFHLSDATALKVTDVYYISPNGDRYKGGASQAKRAIMGNYKFGDAQDYYKNKLIVYRFNQTAAKGLNLQSEKDIISYSTDMGGNQGTIKSTFDYVEYGNEKVSDFLEKPFPTASSPKSINNPSAVGRTAAKAVEGLGVLLFKMSPLYKTSLAQEDIDNMIGAVNTTLDFLGGDETGKYAVNKISEMNGEDILHSTIDLANYLIDGSLPVLTDENSKYRNEVSRVGEILINGIVQRGVKTFNQKKPLKSN